MKRFPSPATVLAWLLAAAPLAYAQDAAGELPCDTGLYEISAAHEGARANACRVFNPRGVILTIDPEDLPPINPSPWFGFHVRAKNANEQGTVVVTLRYSTSRHRYAPRTSVDGREWTPLPERQWLVHEDGRATMELKPGADGLFVSAQENLGRGFYEEWRRSTAERFDGLEWRSIGESRGGRPNSRPRPLPARPTTCSSSAGNTRPRSRAP